TQITLTRLVKFVFSRSGFCGVYGSEIARPWIETLTDLSDRQFFAVIPGRAKHKPEMTQGAAVGRYASLALAPPETAGGDPSWPSGSVAASNCWSRIRRSIMTDRTAAT